MNKRFLVLLLSMVTIVGVISGCGNKEVEKNEDALKFKEEYEYYNGKLNAYGNEYRSVSIDEDNPFVYVTAEEIVEKLENGETFYLYVGDKQCPWCRSSIEKAIEMAKKYNIEKIYYVHIWDDEHNEILRDKYTLDDKNKPVLDIEGTAAYHKLLEHFDELLSEYTLTDKNGKTVKVSEKRIYAPNYFYIENGKAIKLITSNSDLQKGSNDELTEEILKDEENQFTELFSR